MHFADVDAVTVDAYGTLLELRNPVRALASGLRAYGVERDDLVVERAFRAEVEFYGANLQRARDRETLARLREDCTAVFLDAAAAPLEPEEFVPTFAAALVFEPLPGAAETLDALTRRGLALGLVSNWDVSLHDHLESLGLDRWFAVVVTSAEVGAAKPDTRPFEVALAELGVRAARVVHVGDGEADEVGAGAAGLGFLRAPLADAFAGWD